MPEIVQAIIEAGVGIVEPPFVGTQDQQWEERLPRIKVLLAGE